jgi:putative membrane protein
VKEASLRLHLGLGIACLAVFAWSAWMPKDRLTWLLEVAPAIVAAVILAVAYPRWRFTPLVLVLIAIHACILMAGGKYTYAEVPLFNWLRDEYGLARNYYDRVGHFAQGFVPAMVGRELLLRKGVLPRGKWLFFLLTCACLAVSAFYELIEWWVAAVSDEAAEAFLGTQGDVWDTQWDMFIALCGAMLAQWSLSGLQNRQLGIAAPPSGSVNLREVDAGNIDLVGDIRVDERQKYHVASVAKTIWQASGRKDVWIRAVCAGDTPVGLVALRDPSLSGGPGEEIYFARLIVDLRHQGRGYGKAAIREVLAYARARPGCRRVRLSHMPANEAVGRLYERLGFRHTGTVDEDGELEMILEL